MVWATDGADIDYRYRLQIHNILEGIPKAHRLLGSDHDAWMSTAKAICTDTFPKLISRQFTIASTTYHIVAWQRAQGRFMATLPGFIVTDAPISVDGDMSTNDTVVILANGAAGGDIIEEGASTYEVLKVTVASFAEDLAKLVVRDGEGATKFVTRYCTPLNLIEEIVATLYAWARDVPGQDRT